MRRPLLIIGAGGHGRVVGSIAAEVGRTILGYVDDDPATWGRVIDGRPVLGAIEMALDVSHGSGGIDEGLTGTW